MLSAVQAYRLNLSGRSRGRRRVGRTKDTLTTITPAGTGRPLGSSRMAIWPGQCFRRLNPARADLPPKRLVGFPQPGHGRNALSLFFDWRNWVKKCAWKSMSGKPQQPHHLYRTKPCTKGNKVLLLKSINIIEEIKYKLLIHIYIYTRMRVSPCTLIFCSFFWFIFAWLLILVIFYLYFFTLVAYIAATWPYQRTCDCNPILK